MRNASIILPARDNDGADLSPLHAILAAELCNTFGGFTASAVTGAWRDDTDGRIYQDESTEYRIAADWNPAQREALESIAARYCAEARQVVIYVQHANGAVSFVPPVEYAEAVETAPRTGEPDHKGARRKQAEAFGELFARVA
ncbi:hypothetical protein BAJUN_01870 [Bajunvirus bajun]|uniref:Uncharacterized protein n=1 Tax=Brevundimonas phage vB_BgoS-Bajun TaxID=2948594 RepID=A0A9E7N7C7_9CAUD|nr:hypothetical protein BAJUN_01870 [Brevundimonas phage vB_BgoS-Bajun]